MTAAERNICAEEKPAAQLKNKNILGSARHAAQGAAACYREERNFGDYTIIALTFLGFNMLLGSALWEYIVLIVLTAAVFAAEFLNTAIERLVDSLSGEINAANKFIKDAAAAAVLMFGGAFFLCEGLILLPKLAEVIK